MREGIPKATEWNLYQIKNDSVIDFLMILFVLIYDARRLEKRGRDIVHDSKVSLDIESNAEHAMKTTYTYVLWLRF